MDERLNERLRRATAEATAQGFAAMIVAPSPDLAYLTGYEPMPMERPTLLVLRADRDPVMLVPELERPLAAASSRRSGRGTRRLDRRRRPVHRRGPPARATGPGRGGRPPVGLARPGAARRAARPDVRTRLTRDRPVARREGRRRARGVAPSRPWRRRDLPTDLFLDLPGPSRGGDRRRPRRPPRPARPRLRRFHHRGERAQLRLAAP